MDKIDVVLFRYRRERKKCPEIIKMAVIMYIPLFITLIIDVVSLIFFFSYDPRKDLVGNRRIIHVYMDEVYGG